MFSALWKRAATDRIAVPFCRFNMYNHALDCRGFGAVGFLFFKEGLIK